MTDRCSAKTTPSLADLPAKWRREAGESEQDGHEPDDPDALAELRREPDDDQVYP